MRGTLLIVGQGYVGDALARAARARGLSVVGVRRRAGPDVLAFDDARVKDAIRTAHYIVCSVPPDEGGDPVLATYGAALADSGAWLAYLSSTGVYGDVGGAWVDEGSPVVGAGGAGRRRARADADRQWRERGACVLRLPGIYGPGRSVFDQLRAGNGRRIDRPGHRFSRIHVDDIVGGLLVAMGQRLRGVYNLADSLPAEPRALVEEACRLAGFALPPLLRLEDAGLSAAARGFWAESRLVAGDKFRRATGYRWKYPDYTWGLRAIWAAERSI